MAVTAWTELGQTLGSQLQELDAAMSALLDECQHVLGALEDERLEAAGAAAHGCRTDQSGATVIRGPRSTPAAASMP